MQMLTNIVTGMAIAVKSEIMRYMKYLALLVVLLILSPLIYFSNLGSLGVDI